MSKGTTLEASTAPLSGAEVIRNVMQEYHQPHPIKLADTSVDAFLAPEGLELVDLTPLRDTLRDAPRRQRGKMLVHAIADLIAVSKRFGIPNESTCYVAIMADGRGHVRTIFDHPRGGPNPKPGFSEFEVRHDLMRGEAIGKWIDVAKNWLSQADFAAFLEERLLDMAEVSPDSPLQTFAQRLMARFALPTQMLEAARGVGIHVGQQIKQTTNLDTGAVSVVFVEEHTKDAGAVEIPRLFAIRAPLWEHGVEYEIPVRVRYKVNDQKILWKLEPQILDKVVEHASNELTSHLTETLATAGIEVVRGTF